MRILLFAQLKDLAGRSEIGWPGAGAMSQEQFWQRLLREFPGLSTQRSIVRLARNGEYARRDEPLAGDDEIALIPPVSGG